MCEEMAGRFGGKFYHSDVREMLESWRKGPMFATGAIGAGVNIDGIMTVIHIGVPYGMIPFVQESGRAGRRGEKVRSVVLLSGNEMTRCRGTNPEDLKVDEVVMRDYIVREDCRRKVLSGYLNGEELNCVEIDGELCDYCLSTTDDGSLREKRGREEEARVLCVKRARMSEGRVEDVRLRVMRVGGRSELVEDHLELCKNMCGGCAVISGWEMADHKFSECDELDGLVGFEGYERWKERNIRLECDGFD